jgi:hypothetical protein
VAQAANGTGEQVDLLEAAHRLGIGVDAVRKRLTRGSLRGEKVDGHWFVWLPDVSGNVRNFPDAERSIPDNVRTSVQPGVDELLAVERRRANDLAEQVGTLTRQLEARTTAEQELRVLLLRQSEQLARLLPAPHEAEPATPAVDEPAPPASGTPGLRWRWPWQRTT